MGEFLDYFMIKNVMPSKELMKTVGRVMRKFVKWMHEKGYMPEEEFEDTAELVDELKDELPKVEEISGLIYDYIQNNPIDDFTENVHGYFRVTKIESRKLWLEDYMRDKRTVGPVSVSTEISSMCKVGWVIIVKDIIYLTYILNTLRSLRSLRCMILVTAKSAKSAKIV